MWRRALRGQPPARVGELLPLHTRCQRRSGTAASPQALIEPESLRIVQGEELVRTYRPPDGWAKLFCSGCGSALFSQSQADPGQMTDPVRTNWIADPGIRPQVRYHVGTAAVWEPIPDDGLPRQEGGRT